MSFIVLRYICYRHRHIRASRSQFRSCFWSYLYLKSLSFILISLVKLCVTYVTFDIPSGHLSYLIWHSCNLLTFELPLLMIDEIHWTFDLENLYRIKMFHWISNPHVPCGRKASVRKFQLNPMLSPTGNNCQFRRKFHPIRVVEQGNYHVIVVIECSVVQYPMISMLFIP